jgi:hypothetical protein
MTKTEERLIDAFMGAESVLNARFDTSWDWLMPVVSKITNECPELDCRYPELQKLTYGLIDVDIDAVYRTVLDLIERYNNIHKPKELTNEKA